MVKINPYNFVPLAGDQPTRQAWQDIPRHHCLSEETFSGELEVKIYTMTPVFIPSTLPGEIHLGPCGCNPNCSREKRTFKRFHYNSDNKPTIPASSLKGMIRAVFEGLTNSCMVLFAETYGGNTYSATEYKSEKCTQKTGLCLACATFGTICGDDLPFMGKVRFSDAIGDPQDLEGDPNNLNDGWILKELSAPKPERHLPFYAKVGLNASSGPRGRKVYYHHDPNKVLAADYITPHNHRNVRILQRLKHNVALTAPLHFHGLTEEQLAFLLYALELEYEVVEKNGNKIRNPIWGHKIGMGKPLGLGSITLEITHGRIMRGNQIYQSLTLQPLMDIQPRIDSCRQWVKNLPEFQSLFPHLNDLFCLTKHTQGAIGYPGHGWFTANNYEPLGDLGEFEGTLTRAPCIPPSAAAPRREILDRPLDPGETLTGRIFEITGNTMIIEAADGNLYSRPKAVTGVKVTNIVIGLEVTLKGNAVLPQN